MGKTVLNSPYDFKSFVGKNLGKSNWKLINQKSIDDFANATEDFQWIHVDTNRTKKESPYKKTIAHGYLSLSLIPKFVEEIWECKNLKLILNYEVKKLDL